MIMAKEPDSAKSVEEEIEHIEKRMKQLMDYEKLMLTDEINLAISKKVSVHIHLEEILDEKQ